MNKIKTSVNSLIFFAAALCSAVISVILRSINLFCFFDSEIGYYSQGAVLPTLSNLLLLCFALFLTVFSFVRMKEKEQGGAEASRLPLRLGIGIAVIALLTAALATSYFDQKVQMNAPDKILFGLACAFSMIFTANELKAAVGTKRPFAYELFASLTLLFGATSSIPSIIAYHTGALVIPVPVDTDPKSYLILNVAKYYFILAITVYTAIRLFASSSGTASEITDTPSDSKSEAPGTDA